MKNLRIGWFGDRATACYVDRANHFQEIAGYAYIQKDKKDYKLRICGADERQLKSLRIPAEKSRGLRLSASKILLSEMLKTA